MDATSQKKNKKKQMGSEHPSRKHPRSESDSEDGNEGNLPSAVETLWKGKEKVTESLHLLDVDIDVDIAAEERRTLKIGVKANRLEMDPPLLTPKGQTFGRGNNHIPAASLEEDLVHSKREEEKLKATIEALEKEKSEMNARVTLMERKNIYELLEAKMEGFQIANHLGMIGGFKNLNLTIMRKWMEILVLNLEEFEKCPADYLESTRIRLEYEPTILFDIPPTDNLAFPVILDLTMDGHKDPSSLPPSQIVPVLALVDLTEYALSPEDEGSKDQGWPQIHDEDMQQSLQAWIFVPIHGNNHWSLAIILIHNDVAMLAHLDSFRGTHDPEAIFHVLTTFLCLTMSIDPALVQTAIMNLDQQKDGHSCGKHVLQMLAGAGMKESR
ncbi:hypothetical protein R1flu_019613 [Riccia fluitans]|uniref:Ubiquitin-like protease family profile domain-containing protein n=1 Tax=Riccia fluitans TaxID=41844 RepID=A0ABD1ZKK8_9MARC